MKKIQISLDASPTVEMDEAAWKARVADMADEEDPEQAALDQLAQEVEGVDFDFPDGRGWLAFADNATLI